MRKYKEGQFFNRGRQPYKYGGRTVPGMYKNNLPRAQFGLPGNIVMDNLISKVNKTTDHYKDDIRNIGSWHAKVIEANPLIQLHNLLSSGTKYDFNQANMEHRAKIIANKINSFLGGAEDYWKRGGSI